jgi:hypothetical protein
MASRESLRSGMNTAVTTRPTRRGPGLMTCQPPSNWFGYPARLSTPQASSAVTSPRRFNTSSGTLGRPSGKRSPFHSRVNSRRCVFEKRPNWAKP